jgi:uncharacterized protein YtpQ (UPF0354 family)
MTTEEPDASLIVPLIKAAIPLAASSPPVDLPAASTPIGGGRLVGELVVMYAFDLPDCFQFVAQRDCERLGLSGTDLLPLAIANLRRRLPPVQRLGCPPTFGFLAGGNLEASLLLLDEVWDELAPLVPGELVAAVPARDVVVVTGSDSSEGLAIVRSSVERVWVGGDHLLTKQLLVWRDRRWQLLEGPAC